MRVMVIMLTLDVSRKKKKIPIVSAHFFNRVLLEKSLPRDQCALAYTGHFSTVTAILFQIQRIPSMFNAVLLIIFDTNLTVSLVGLSKN